MLTVGVVSSYSGDDTNEHKCNIGFSVLQHHPSNSYAQRNFKQNVANMFFLSGENSHHAIITRNTKVKGKFDSIQAQSQLLLLGLSRAKFAFVCPRPDSGNKCYVNLRNHIEHR